MLLGAVMMLMAGLVGAMRFLQTRPVADDEDFRRAALTMEAFRLATECADGAADGSVALRELLDIEGPWRTCMPAAEEVGRELYCARREAGCVFGARAIGAVAGELEHQVLERCSPLVERADPIARVHARCTAFPIGHTHASDVVRLGMLLDVELVFGRERVRTGQHDEAIARFTASLALLTEVLRNGPDLEVTRVALGGVWRVVQQLAAILASPVDLASSGLAEREAEVRSLAAGLPNPTDVVVLNALAGLPGDAIPAAATSAGDLDELVWAIGDAARLWELPCDGSDDAACAQGASRAAAALDHAGEASWSERLLSPRLLDARALRETDYDGIRQLERAVWTRGLLYALALAFAHRRLSVDECASDAAVLAERTDYELELSHPSPGETVIHMPAWWPTSLERPELMTLVCPRVALPIGG
jgi:hypothetical protein